MSSSSGKGRADLNNIPILREESSIAVIDAQSLEAVATEPWGQSNDHATVQSVIEQAKALRERFAPGLKPPISSSNSSLFLSSLDHGSATPRSNVHSFDDVESLSTFSPGSDPAYRTNTVRDDPRTSTELNGLNHLGNGLSPLRAAGLHDIGIGRQLVPKFSQHFEQEPGFFTQPPGIWNSSQSSVSY